MRRLVTWLIIAFAGVVLLATTARTLVLSYSLRNSEQSQAVETAMENARDIAAWATERWERAPSDVRFSMAALARVANARIWLVDAQGRVWVDTQGNPSWEGVVIESSELERALRGEESRVSGKSPWLESAVACVVPVVRGQQVLGAVYLFVPVETTPGNYAGPLWWSAAFTLAMSALVAVLVARKLAAPVEAITRFARSLGEGNFSGAVQVRSIEEVNVLAATLTQVSGQLKASFDALRAERQRLAAVLESMQEGVLAMDAGGRLTLVNPAASVLLGWKPGGVPETIHSPPFPEKLRQVLLQPVDGEVREIYLRLKDTQELLAVCSPVPGPSGQGVGALVVLQDLSSVLRLQRLRENFIADVAHELRGPLANLSVLAEAFGDGTITWEDREAYVRTLQDEVARLGRLSRDVLDLAELDAGVMTVALEPVDLASLVNATVARLEGRCRTVGVKLEHSVPAGLQALASPLRTEQVLANLLENAIRYTPPGGTVRLDAGLSDGQVCITVADNGAGIPAEHLPSIFERFYKVDPARTLGKAGTGLGLSIVKQLVELQGGRVEVSSQLGQGTKFRVYLRACE